MSQSDRFSRRRFIQTTGAAAMGSAVFTNPLLARATPRARQAPMRVALVGTGVRGVSMYGRDLLRDYGDFVELVGVCDANPGRLDYGHQFIGADCPKFVDLDEMLTETQPERLIVTAWDYQHHECIITGMRHGCDIICEKPVTIDEQKAQAILDAKREYGREMIVTHNYRYAPHRAKLKELLQQEIIGDIRTIDLHWNISHGHLQRYMQRWHGERDKGGTLWVHKGSHHFDLVNWWLDSEPVEVFAWGALERFGSNGPYRSEKCRGCQYQGECDYYWDITRDDHLVQLYVNNEHHDGYVRDNCVYRENISIYDKHSAVVKYANGAYLNYSLMGSSDFEGFWLAVNGTKGRIEGREGPMMGDGQYHEWTVNVRGQEPEVIRVDLQSGGHWGGDRMLKDMIFKDPGMADPLHLRASLREGVMAILVGVAARTSIDNGQPVQIAGLTELEPEATRLRG